MSDSYSTAPLKMGLAAAAAVGCLLYAASAPTAQPHTVLAATPTVVRSPTTQVTGSAYLSAGVGAARQQRQYYAPPVRAPGADALDTETPVRPHGQFVAAEQQTQSWMAALLLPAFGAVCGYLASKMLPARPLAMSAVSSDKGPTMDRRTALLSSGVALGMVLADPQTAQARLPNPPEGYVRFRSVKQDGYDFLLPETWVRVRGAGDTVVFRNPLDIEENLFMEISSPSASKYVDLADVAPTPEACAERLKKDLITEFMSTRIGVRREAEVVSAVSRVGALDGVTYYDIDLRIRSYTNERELAAYPEERTTIMEWDWHFITTVGVANKRLYQLRLKVPHENLDAARPVVKTITESFRAYEVAVDA